MKVIDIEKSNMRAIKIARPGDQLDAAGRINYFHHIAHQAGKIAIQSALYAGLELYREKQRRKGVFDKWVEQNCEFSRVTAYRYLALVQQAIGANHDLVALTNDSDQARQKAVEQFSSRVESRSLNELMCDYGIVTKSKSNLGGKREGAGRKRKDALELAAAADQLARDPALVAMDISNTAGELYKKSVVEEGLRLLSADEVQSLIKVLDLMIKASKKVLKDGRNNR